MAARQEEGRYETQLFVYFLVREGRGVARGTVIEEIRPGAVFKTGDFVIEKRSGGATVVRLREERNFCPATCPTIEVEVFGCILFCDFFDGDS